MKGILTEDEKFNYWCGFARGFLLTCKKTVRPEVIETLKGLIGMHLSEEEIEEVINMAIED